MLHHGGDVSRGKQPEKVRSVEGEGQAGGGVTEEGVGEVGGGGVGEGVVGEGGEVTGGGDVREE